MAAGAGTRMRSALPKPLHVLCGRPMLLHILDAVAELAPGRVVVVVGHDAETVAKAVGAEGPDDLVVDFVEQRPARGTGDAVSVALTAFPDDEDDDGDIVVLAGDTPLVRSATLAALMACHRAGDAAATLLTAKMDDPTGMGRVVRARNGQLSRIVEELDANAEERQICEVATSIYCFRRSLLAPALRRLQPASNLKGEYYLTDVVAVLHRAGHKVIALDAPDPSEALGVNDRVQLAHAESLLRRRINEKWMRAGVTMLDPTNTYIDATVRLSPDVTIYPGTVLAGRTSVAPGCRIGPATRLVDCVVGAGARVEHSVAYDAEIAAGAVVGPFAHIRPGTSVVA